MHNKDILLEGDGAQGQATAPNGVNHLLVIAIDEYAHCPKLNNCVKDAKELIEVLEAKYDISIDNNILPPLFNSEATKENIVHSFRKLAEKVTSNDNVLIYFSGHGEYDKVFKQGYWVPVEGEKGKVTSYLPNSEVLVFLNAIQSHHTFLMVDSCFSGTLFRNEGHRNLQRLEQDPSRWCLTSGRNEIVSDGEAGKNSPFAKSLLYRLRQNTGNLSVPHLCTLVVEQVAANTMQTPRGEALQVEGHSGGQFVFKLRKSSEVSEWEEASQSQSIDALLDFLNKYPQTCFKKEAREKIDYLEDFQDWERVKHSGKIADLLEYKDSHPKGRFIEEAEQRLNVLRASRRDADAWQRAQNEHSAQSYQQYLEEYPDGANAAKAKDGLETLKKNENVKDEQSKAEETVPAKDKDNLKSYEQAEKKEQEKEKKHHRKRAKNNLEKVEDRPSTDDNEMGTITFSHIGPYSNCFFDLTITIGSREIKYKDFWTGYYRFPLGKQYYKIYGTINCITAGYCSVMGQGYITVKDNSTIYINWINDNYAKCSVTLTSL